MSPQLMDTGTRSSGPDASMDFVDQLWLPVPLVGTFSLETRGFCYDYFNLRGCPTLLPIGSG